MKTALLSIALLVACRTDDPPEGELAQLPEPQKQGDQPTIVEDERPPGYIGTLTAKDSAEVVAPFKSSVTELKVKLGDSVTQGQPVAVLDARSLKQELAIANAELRTARTGVGQAKVKVDAAKAALKRAQKGYDEGVLPKEAVDQAEDEVKGANAAAISASARVEEQKAKIERLNARLTDTSLVSPIAGRIALIYVTANPTVEEGQPVVRVISSDELFVKFAIPADKRGTLAPNDEIEVKFEVQSEGQPSTAKGIVRHVAPELDPVAQMILADAELVDPPSGLQSGITCRILPKKPAKSSPAKP